MTDSQNPSKSLLIAILSFGLGLVFNWLFFDKLIGISYPLFIASALISYFGLSSHFKIKLTASSWILGIVILVLASFVALRESESLTFFNVASSFFLLLVLASLTIGRRLLDYEIVDYLKAIFIAPFRFVASIPGVIANLFGSRKHPAVRGLVITIPILLVFILLFSSADLVFQKYLTKIFTFDLSEILPRIILISVVTLAFAGAFGYLFLKERVAAQGSAQSRSFVGLTEVRILFGAINVLFLAFILVQFAYLFGGEDNITKLGFTYADYARKGFFELIAVAAFSFLVVFAVERHAPRSGEKHTGSFKVLAGIVIVQVILIMASSFKRLSLYENAYGFTVDRFYAHALIIGLGVVFLLLLYKIAFDQAEKRFVFNSFVAAILFLITINLLNPDLFIAKQNIDQRLAQNEPSKLDVKYLQTLSTDATLQMLRLLDYPDDTVRQEAVLLLNSYKERLLERKPWQSFHFGRQKALSIINKKL